MTIDAQIREESERVLEMVMSDDPTMHKEAAQDLSDFTRIQNREGSFVPAIIEPSQFDKSRLTKTMHSDQALMLFEYEQTSPFAVPVDYGTTPTDFIPKGRRYPVIFNRVQTRNVVYDVLELQTYDQDIRQVMGDNMTKDLIALRDSKFIAECKKILSTVGTVLPWAGQAMHVDMASPLTHNAFARSKNTMRGTRFAIEPSKVLMNHLRKVDFEVMAVEELQGTDTSVDIAFKGFTKADFSGMQLLFTIKNQLVPTAETYWFGDQEFLGRYVQWVEPTMSLKKEDTQVQFYLYEVFGITIAHPGALSINRFLG